MEQVGLQKWMAWTDGDRLVMVEYPKEEESTEEAEETEQEDHHLKRRSRSKRSTFKEGNVDTNNIPTTLRIPIFIAFLGAGVTHKYTFRSPRSQLIKTGS